MTVSTGTKTFENLKLENYRSDIAKTCSFTETEGANQRDGISKKKHQKTPRYYQNLDFNITWL